MDGKKYLFLSFGQRLAVSLALTILALCAIGLIVFGARQSGFPKLYELGAEMLKLILTASAAWVLILLYASSNSFGRIERETRIFFEVDLLRPSKRDSSSLSLPSEYVADDEVQTSMECIARTASSVTYRVTDAARQSLHFWCSLNVHDLAVVFMLPASTAPYYESIYAATLAGFRRRGVEVISFGLVAHKYGNASGTAMYLELYLTQSFAKDFLFNAAARHHAAQSLFGDVRSFLVCMRRAEESPLSDSLMSELANPTSDG